MKAILFILTILSFMTMSGCDKTGSEFKVNISPDQTIDQCLRKELYEKCFDDTEVDRRWSSRVRLTPSARCDQYAIVYSIRLRENVAPNCRLN